MLRVIDVALIMSPDFNNHLMSRVGQALHDLIPFECNPKDMSPTTTTPLPSVKNKIPASSSMDVLSFREKHLVSGHPVVFPNFSKDWPAVDTNSDRKWTLSRLRQLVGHRTVPVELGSKYTDPDWTQTMMTLGNFIDEFIHKTNKKAYVAQVNLFDQMPILRKDFSIPDLTALSAQDLDDDVSCDINAWFGPEVTVSPLHFDDKDNIFIQVMGVKYVRLYSRDIPSELIYPKTDNLLKNTSEIDIDLLDEKQISLSSTKFPKFFTSDTNLFMSETVLTEGDALFIPKGTWHFVKSLSTSFSISFWWS